MELFQTQLFQLLQEHHVNTVEELVASVNDLPYEVYLQKDRLADIEAGHIKVGYADGLWTLNGNTSSKTAYLMLIDTSKGCCRDGIRDISYYGEIEEYAEYFSFVSNGECVAIWKA